MGGFVKLLDCTEAGDTPIVIKLDRIGRDSIDVQQTVRLFTERSIRLPLLAAQQATSENAIHVSHSGGAMPLSIRLPEDVEARLSRLAARTGRTKTFYVTEAVREHIDDLEDLYLAEQRLGANRAGESQTVSLEEVERRLGLAD